MINMMYLVFIAMLALQISKEVLATLGIVSEDLEKSTAQLKTVIDESYDDIFGNSNQDYYKIPSEELPKLKEITNDYFDFLQKFKDSLIKLDENEYKIDVEYIDDKGNQIISQRTDYQVMDKSNYLDETFFINDGVTAKGQKYIDYFKGFSTKVESVLDSITNRDARTVQSNYNFDNALASLSQRFEYPDDDKVVNRDGIKEDWIYYNYEKFPLVASLTKITKIQADIRTVEYEILNSLIQKTQKRKLDLGGSDTLLEVKGSAYYTNSIANPAVLVGRTDPNFKPDKVELQIDGIDLRESEYNIENGKIILNKRFSRPGIKKITGFLIFEENNKIDSLEVDREFVVMREPTSAVISADNMRVFYRKLQNPTSISIPGVADNTINPSSNGGIFEKTSSGWKVTPTTNDSIMKIKVSGKLNNQTKLFDGGEFRVKNPPDGIGSIEVNGNYSEDGKSLTKLFINNGIVTGTKPKDFDYKYDIVVTSFDVKVGRLPVQNVNGNRVNRNAAAVDDVESQPKGTPVRFQNIKAKTIDGNVVNDGYIIMPFTIFIK